MTVRIGPVGRVGFVGLGGFVEPGGDRVGGFRRGRPDADQLVAGGAVAGETTVRLGGGGQCGPVLVRSVHVGGVPDVERLEGGEIGVRGGARVAGFGRRLRGGGLLTGPIDHLYAPRGFSLLPARSGLAGRG